MIIIKKMIKTCHACPSQWDGWDGDNEYYYFRFRYGNLTVQDEAGTYVYSETISDSFDGTLSFEQLKSQLKSQIIFDLTPENLCNV
jgi:predicted metal-binding protein